MKVALYCSQVEELEVAFLGGIHDWLSRFNQQTKTNGSKQDNIKKRGTTVFSHIVTCVKTSLIVGVFDKYIDTLKSRLAKIGIHTTEHYIAKGLLTSQYGGSDTTERLCADWIFR